MPPRAQFATPPLFMPRRLGKLVRDSTTLTVREIRAACRDGRIRVDGVGANSDAPSLEQRVFEDDVVRLDGQRLQPRRRDFVAMLNKPAGVTSTCRDPARRSDLTRWLERMPAGSFPIGRLDRETTGVLLFANDGDLANALLRPGHRTAKRYRLQLRDALTRNDARLDAMVASNAEYVAASRARLLEGPEGQRVELVLHEGKNRQIRRMCYALGLRLMQLKRVAVGPVELGALQVGELRVLGADEVEALWRATGGRGCIEQAQLAALYREAADLRASARPDRRLERWLARYAAPPLPAAAT